MNTITLNFVNRSNDTNNNSVVIFQKNIAQGQKVNCIAWKVIKNCPPGFNHPISYTPSLSVSALDWKTKNLGILDATAGQAFDVSENDAGEASFQLNKDAKVSTEIEVSNNLSKGSINVNCYLDKQLFSVCNNIVPGQSAAFAFQPFIFIGVIPELAEGELMNASLVSQIRQKISLEGIKSADIVMTGGGIGAEATAFSFELDNVVYETR